MTEWRQVGVVGAGVMGTGIAQDLAAHGFHVLLLDESRAMLDRALQNVIDGLRLQLLFGKPGNGETPAAVVARITATTDTEQFGAAAFVIENVVEKPPIKQAVYGWLDRICPRDCVFAANTSAISITRIAAWTSRPTQVVGMHFMNPVPMKQTVEVIRGHHTSEATLARAQELLSAVGKRGIVVNDAPGFVSNRVLMLTINEAVNLVAEGVSTAEQVDDIFRSCFGHKMGPLETADLIGLDTILYSLEVLYESFADCKYRPSQLLRRMVDAGLHGRKSGGGFYRHPSPYGGAT